MQAVKLKKVVESNATNVVSNQLDVSMEFIHKETIKPVVTKILSVYTGILVVSCYSWDMNWAMIVGICVGTAVFNIYFDDKSLNFKIGKIEIYLNQDTTDAIRWMVNIVFVDIPLSFLMGLSSIALAGFWTIVLISIIAETYKKSHRYLVFSIALVSSIICMVSLSQDLSVKNSMFWIINQLTISTFFISIEKFWSDAVLQKMSSIRRMKEAIDYASKLKRDALIGEHARIISHEIANLMMGFNLLTKSKNDPDYLPLKSGLNYLQRISRLVLDEIQIEPLTQETILSELIHDINAILGRQVKQRRIQWEISYNNLPKILKFVERSGSVYLMLQNLIKNATEAILRKHHQPNRGKIVLHVAFEDNCLVMKVVDNGPGFGDILMKQIISGTVSSDSVIGHGLGLKFVHSECQKNGFELIIGNNSNNGAYVGMKIHASEIVHS